LSLPGLDDRDPQFGKAVGGLQWFHREGGNGPDWASGWQRNAIRHGHKRRTKRLVEAFATSAVNYFFNQEIESLGVFTVKECCGNPNFVSDFDLGWNLGLIIPLCDVLHHDQVL